MARSCSLCVHAKRRKIEAAILGGESTRGVARRFAVSDDALQRHKSHMSKALAMAKTTSELAHGDALLLDVQALRERADSLGAQAEASGDIRTALIAIRELTRITELMARLNLEARAGTAADITNNPVWHEFVAGLIETLQSYPDAERAVITWMRTKLGLAARPE